MLKNFPLLLLLFLGIQTSKGQNNLFIQNIIEEDFSDTFDYHLYHNEKLIYTECNLLHNDSILSNLPSGNYQIQYNSLFGIAQMEVKFDSIHESKTLRLPTEELSEYKRNTTPSYLEFLKDNEIITIAYAIQGCFISTTKTIAITKKNNKYYQLKKGKRRSISKKKINHLIEYERIVQNINSTENLHAIFSTFTCDEHFSLTKGNDTLILKILPCGEWSRSNKYIKCLN